MRVGVTFTDGQGRRWKAYDRSVIAGHKYRRSPGEHSTEFRGFLNESTGERREYRFPDEKAPRLLSEHPRRQLPRVVGGARLSHSCPGGMLSRHAAHVRD